ncbi:polysaccharide lyase [Sandaracinus amylolyticus]|uniref:polysaccharide lyase n=1 Tax=Sandaracinus amylolyticus TaxID=927083 RepID=UPI00146FED99|nr:polysaccharide lyase [Sandaracinus amylolyticus]
MRRHVVLGLVAVSAMTALASRASAQVAWRGDFETGDTSQFSYRLNETVEGRRYITVQSDTVVEGTRAARIELHDDAVWPNGLKRVELSHQPDAARTAEGAETYFAWSLYLPETLSSDPAQTIGYWESADSYRQMMAFDLSGTTLTFTTRQPSNVEQWRGEGVITPGEWHRIAMHVRWSKDAAIGRVSVWLDGDRVVDGAVARTLNDDNPHFVQIGLLRGAISFSDVPVIVIDDVVEGNSLADVRPADLPGEEPDAGVMERDAGVIDAGGVDAGSDAGRSDASSDADAGRMSREDEIVGGSCAVGRGRPTGTLVIAVLLTSLGMVVRRRRR